MRRGGLLGGAAGRALPFPARFASTGTYRGADSTTHAISAPEGVRANSVIIIIAYVDGTSDPGITLPTGFVHAENSPVYVDPPGGDSQNHRLIVAWRRAPSVESGPYTLTLGSSRYVEAQAHRYEGCITSGTPFDPGTDSDGSDTSASSTPAVSITTAGRARTLLHAGTNWAGGTWTPPAGFLKRQQGAFGLVTLADKAQYESGATGSISATATGSDKRQAWLGALISSGPRTNGFGRFQTRGRYLYDPNGDRVVLRGAENRWWQPWLDVGGDFLPQIAQTGANAVRVIPYYPPETENPPTSGITPLTLHQMENLITRALANCMVPVFHIPGTQAIETSALLAPEIVSLLMRYQDRIIVDGLGESTADSGTEWRDIMVDAVVTLRGVGYTCPLLFMTNHFGRNLPTILNYGADVVAADPISNTILGWQAYWGSPGNFYQNLYGMTLTQAMNAVAALPFPVQVGVSYKTDPAFDPTQIMDYDLVISLAATHGISWLWWDWSLSGSGLSLTTNGSFGSWNTPYGQDVAVTDPNGLSGAVRSTFLLAGGEQGTGGQTGQSAVALVAVDGETISGSSQSNFLDNGYYTRKGFTRAADWVGPNPLGGNFAGWDDPNFIIISTWLTDFSGTGFYSRMDDLAINTMLPAAGSITLANNITFGKGALVPSDAFAGGTISSGDDPGVFGVSSGEEPSTVSQFEETNAARAAWLGTSDGPGRFGYYNFADNLLNGDIGNVYFPVDMMTSADLITCDQYWFAGAGDNAGDTRFKLHYRLYTTSGSATQTQCARGSHYGSMLDSMRKHLNSTTTRPFMVAVENGAPYADPSTQAITPDQMKWAVWATLVHGARGIIYFNHTFREDDPLATSNNFNSNGYGGPGVAGNGIYAAAKTVNRQALAIASVINSPFDGYFVYGDTDNGSIATAGFLTAVTSTNTRSEYAGVDACCKWQPVERKHYILATTREPEAATNIPATFRMLDQGQTTAVPVFGGSNITIQRGGSIPGGFCEFSDTFATAAAYKCYRID